jgi:hypothetical protein
MRRAGSRWEWTDFETGRRSAREPRGRTNRRRPRAKRADGRSWGTRSPSFERPQPVLTFPLPLGEPSGTVAWLYPAAVMNADLRTTTAAGTVEQPSQWSFNTLALNPPTLSWTEPPPRAGRMHRRKGLFWVAPPNVQLLASEHLDLIQRAAVCCPAARRVIGTVGIVKYGH